MLVPTLQHPSTYKEDDAIQLPGPRGGMSPKEAPQIPPLPQEG